MGEAIISRRGGGAPVLTWVKGSLGLASYSSVEGLSDEKRYVISVAAADDTESFTNNSIGLWYLDRGVLTELGGKYYAYHKGAWGVEDGTGMDVSYDSGRFRIYAGSYTSVMLTVAEIT